MQGPAHHIAHGPVFVNWVKLNAQHCSLQRMQALSKNIREVILAQGVCAAEVLLLPAHPTVRLSIISRIVRMTLHLK